MNKTDSGIPTNRKLKLELAISSTLTAIPKNLTISATLDPQLSRWVEEENSWAFEIERQVLAQGLFIETIYLRHCIRVGDSFYYMSNIIRTEIIVAVLSQLALILKLILLS